MSLIAPLQQANHGSHFRAYGLRGVAKLIDPFIGVDHAWMSAPTFPPHPHAGFSAVSYLFLDSETSIANHDSIGNHNLIRPGGLHWITAGRGVVHEEVPAEAGKTVHSLQIFVNLARDQQSIDPFALSLGPLDVPVVQTPGIRVRVPLGRYEEVRSPLNPPTDVTMLDISLEEDTALSVPVASGHCAFVMPIFGPVEVNSRRFDRDDLRLPVFEAQATAHAIALRAPQGSAKAMFFSGRPFGLTTVI
jgi:redox-sensitive bicupin YhaK (pirin superfamily)